MIFLEIESCFLFIMKRRYHRFWRQETMLQKKQTLKYMNSKEIVSERECCTVYGKPKENSVLWKAILEGYTDVMALHQANAGNAIATCGTSLTEDMLNYCTAFVSM
jgi:DNA primase